ncbi:hypothetical protein [Streptomyces coeruleorubidus]|uniref:hypothetical protein n=1 Tax=Streptomyces coeruleorubidus TaxID=116188 RepID=UPI0036974FA7
MHAHDWSRAAQLEAPACPSALPAPAGRTTLEKVGSVTVRDTPGAAQRPYTFVIGDDSKLYSNWWDGSQWHWADHGAPSGQWVREGVGVVVVQDSPNAPEHPYAFFLTDDFRLWRSWCDGSTWHWAQHGAPPSRTISRPLGVTTVRDTQRLRPPLRPPHHRRLPPVVQLVGRQQLALERPGDAQREGHPRLRRRHHGRDAPNAAQRPYAFVIGDDSKMYANWWDGSTWKGADHGTPTGRVLERPGEVLTVQDNPNAAQRPYAFLITDDSELWVNWWSLP